MAGVVQPWARRSGVTVGLNELAIACEAFARREVAIGFATMAKRSDALAAAIARLPQRQRIEAAFLKAVRTEREIVFRLAVRACLGAVADRDGFADVVDALQAEVDTWADHDAHFGEDYGAALVRALPLPIPP